MRPGPKAKLPSKGKKGKVKFTVSCGTPPCDLHGKMKLSYSQARKLNRRGLKISEFKATVGSQKHSFTLNVPKNVRKAAAKAKIHKLRVRVTVNITDDAGLNSHARRNVKVKL